MDVSHSSDKCVLTEVWTTAGQACGNNTVASLPSHNRLCPCCVNCFHSSWEKLRTLIKPVEGEAGSLRPRPKGPSYIEGQLMKVPVAGCGFTPPSRSGGTHVGSAITWAEWALERASAVATGKQSFPHPRKLRKGWGPPQTSERREADFRLKLQRRRMCPSLHKGWLRWSMFVFWVWSSSKIGSDSHQNKDGKDLGSHLAEHGLRRVRFHTTLLGLFLHLV